MANDVVVVKNRLGQKITVPLKDATGTIVAVDLPPRGVSKPIPRTRLTKFARGLQERGFIRIRSAAAR